MLRVEDWKQKFHTLARFSMMQTVVHGLMALSGFLIVRVLDKREFAAYTIGASLQAILGAITDSGLSSGMNAIGGRIWRDPVQLGRLVATTLRLRLRLAVFAAPLTIVVALFLLRQNDVSWSKSLAITAAVLATLWGMFIGNVYAVPLRLRSLYTVVQRVDLLAATVRFLLLALLSWWVLNAFLAILVTAFALAVQGAVLRARASGVVKRRADPDLEQERALGGLVKKQMFSTIFFAFQGQISILVITIFGSVDKVADVGALTRLSIALAIVSSVLIGIVAPTFARCESLGRLLRLFALALLAYIGFAGVLMAGSFLFPEELLWVLGGRYASLTREVPWLVTNAVMGGLIAVLYTLASSRGWVWHAWIVPILTLLAQGLALLFLDLSSVKGVLIFGLISLFPTLIISVYMDLRGLWVSWKTGSLAPVAS